MARARNLKPGFFKNEDLAECTPWARLCFAGLWLLADREGRLEDRPKRIKGELFAFDTVDVEPLLTELTRRGFIVRYQNEDGSFIQVSKFGEHQTPHYSEKPSVIKPPPLQEKERHIEPPNSGSALGVDASSRGVRNPLNPDSLNPESLHPPAKRGKRAGSGQEFPSGFDAFWSAYPRKTGKADAVKAWLRLDPDEALQATLTAAVTRQRRWPQWVKDGGQYVPYPATWLNGSRWLDEAPINGTGPDDSLFDGVH